tara:strand:- start:10611 stop:11696 length:1086 start_codon:yes stop_codon:yes gene_type:complete
MGKIALINDSHFGVKNASEYFLDYQERFFRDVFFPHLVANKIKHIIHLGDYFDHRRHIPVKVMHRSRKAFLDKLREYGIHMHIIPGNHDVLFRSTNRICSLKETLGYYTDCVTIHMEPRDVEICGETFAMIPWITMDNTTKCMSRIAKSNAPIMCAHLELGGFQMMKGIESHASEDGLQVSDLEKFDFVFTGHYHTKNSMNNVHYLGTQYELTWADSEDKKYFHIYDTAARKVTRVRNPETIFHKIYYDDTKDPEGELLARQDELTDTFIRIIVVKKDDTERFDTFVDSVANLDPQDLKVIDSYNSFKAREDEEESASIEIKDTHSLMETYIDSIETDLDKGKLKHLAAQLYVQASNLETN